MKSNTAKMGKTLQRSKEAEAKGFTHEGDRDDAGRQPEEEVLRMPEQEWRQRESELAALLEGSRAVLHHLEFEAAARAIFDTCKRLIGATAGYVALLTEDGTENEVLFLDAGGETCLADRTLPMPVRGLRERAYQAGQTVYENDFASSEWAEFLPPGHARIGNVLFAPLLIKGIAVGLLGLANKPGGFTADDARMASLFGELAAVALFSSRALESLQNSEERFRAVAQTASDAIITVDSCEVIVFWNKAAEKIFGYASSEAVGKPLSFIMPERFRAAHREGMERVVSTGKTRVVGKTVEMVGLRKDGSEFPVELSLSSWKIKGDVFFTGILRDISTRKRAEEEMESLARFPSENRSQVLRVAQDGTICYANAASAPLLALWATDVGQGLPETLRELVAETLDSGESRTTQVTDGERIFSLDLVPVQEAGYVNLYGREVTEQVRAEALLSEQNQFIINVLEALNHPFYVIDANDYTIKMANSAAYQSELPEAVTCYALTHRRNAPCEDGGHRCPLEEIRKTREPVIVEHMHYDREGERRVYEVHGHPIFDSGGNISQIIEYTLDVTERKRAEEALQERTVELGDRVKELNCLYGISALVERPGISLGEILQGTVDLIPPAWQYPETTSARAILDGQEFKTERFSETTGCQQAADIIVYGKPVGRVEVCYHQERPGSEEGAFLKEEWDLLDAIAGRLGKIAEKAWAEAALRESEATATALLNAPTDVAALIDTKGIILRANETMAERFGTSEDELVGTCVWDLFPPDVVAQRKAKVEQVIQSSKPQRYEDWRQGICNDNVLYPIQDMNGKVDRIAISARDVTARKVAEEALQKAHDELELRVQQRTAELAQANQILQAEIAQHQLTTATLLESEDRYRRLVEVAFEAIVIHIAGKIVHINPAGAKLLGAREAEELVGKAIHDFFRPAFWKEMQARTRQAKKQPKAMRRIEDRLIRLDGISVDVEVAATRTTYQGQPAVQIVLHDLTARKRVEREQQRIARDLHDSLGHSLGYLHLKLDQLAASDTLGEVAGPRRELAHMRDVADEAYELVRAMLASLRPSSSSDLAAAMLLQARAIGERGGFEVQVTTKGRPQRLDPIVQQQTLYLFQEALINVERHARAKQVHIDMSWTEDCLTATMVDDGCGFDVDAPRTGEHYGLRIMQERAQEMNGQLTVSSCPASGTEVVLRIALDSHLQRVTD